MNMDKSIINKTDLSKYTVFGGSRLKGMMFAGFKRNPITDENGNETGAWCQAVFMDGMESYTMNVSADSGIEFLERGKCYDLDIALEQKPIKVSAGQGKTRDEILIKMRLIGVYGDIKLPFDKDKK